MSNCEQTKGLTILQHGEQVSCWYGKLYNHLMGIESDYIFNVIPSEVMDILRLNIGLANTPIELKEYHIFHDCGKPFFREVDSEGRQHFPNHAAISYEYWLKNGGDLWTAWFILHDMDLHTQSVEACSEILKHSCGMSLLLTAWSEIFANAIMFGGVDSVGFKMKKKHLLRVTKRLS